MAAKYCPTCQKTFTSTERLCPDDRAVLSLNDPYHLVGRTLLDKYRIDALVGLGGMGAVYYAYHMGIDRRVAFKILQPNIAIGDERVVELFEREAKLAGRLTHENIVDVKDAGHTQDGIAYIVMEWLEGRTLDDDLLKHGVFGFNRAAGIARQIASALGEAHSKHVIHRDLKPGNIMLIDSAVDKDHVKVLDFGIGKAIEETTASSSVSTVVGTPHYASPEQLTVGGRIDGRSDIYSLGVILYRMLGGKLPFNSSSLGEVIQMQLTSEPPPLSKLRPGISREVENLVNSMLSKNPTLRPQNVAEVQSLIDRALPYSEKEAESPAPAPKGDTTIQRGHNMGERTTEEMYVAPPIPRTYSTNIQSASRVKSYVLYAAILGTALIASGYGVYQLVSEKDPGEISASLIDTKPSPAPTEKRAPTPSPTTAEVRTPSQSQTTVVKPAVRITPKPKDRREESPATKKTSQIENRQIADQHYEQARELYRQGRYNAAIAECNEALRLNPQHGKARRLKAEISRFMKILNPR